MSWFSRTDSGLCSYHFSAWSVCSVLPLDLDKQREIRIYKIKSYIFIFRRWRLCGVGEQSERVCTHKRAVGSWNSQREPTSAKVLDFTSSWNSHATHMATPLHPCNVCFSLAMAYTQAMLFLHWSQLTSTHWFFSGIHFVEFIYCWMYHSTKSTGFITCQGNILQVACTVPNGSPLSSRACRFIRPMPVCCVL